MRRNGANSWLDFWNGDTAIYACDRHKELHYEAVARDLRAHIPSPDSLVLDYGCGEALSAARLAQDCGTLLLYDAAPHVREKLRARFGREAGIGIMEDGALKAVDETSLDLVVANSLIQYLAPNEFSQLLDLWRAKLKADGRLLLADIPTPQSGALNDAAALLRFGWRGGFFFAALSSLARLYFSDYRRLRNELGFSRYRAGELEGLLRRHGYDARLSPRNIGHNQSRLCFIAQREDQIGASERSSSGCGASAPPSTAFTSTLTTSFCEPEPRITPSIGETSA
jgi:SAM-dependent methyltransferase